MRIAIAGVEHETNTYCKQQTGEEAFYKMRGERILSTEGQASSLGGAVSTCRDMGVDPVPIFAVGAQPSGTITASAYQAFKDEILQGLEREAPLDGVMLALHGAGVVEGIEDLEGDLVMAIRELVGEAVPITASFDLHGNITQLMADALDGVFACHQYPHIDMHDRGREAVELIVRMLDENFRPVSHVETLPMLLPTTTTFLGPGKAMLETMLAAEEEPGVIDVSWFHGFPYTDISHVGCHIVVTTEGDREQARSVASRLALGLWEKRDDFRPLSLSADQAVDQARRAVAEGSRPVIINETSDNCGGGAPGDGTHLLRAMLDAGLKNSCFGFMVDPDVAGQAHAAGVGNTIEVSLGAKYDDLHGEPLEVSAYVKSLHDGRFTLQAMLKGVETNLGPMARLIVADIDIIVASNRSQTFDSGPFLALGIDVMRYDIVALKSSNHFRAGFQDIASKIITADPPGLTTHHIEIFPRHHNSRPMWPIDENAEYLP